MLDALRKFFQSKAGTVTAGIVVLLGLIAAVYTLKSTFGMSELEQKSRDRMFVDSATGKPFEHTVAVGDRVPIKAPSGGNTGYPAEACFWTRDGKIKKEPTWVMLNDWKGSKEPTFCPDCGRLVVPLNPAPQEGRQPPPTKEEYMKSHPAPSR